jgi:hypothetical protein
VPCAFSQNALQIQRDRVAAGDALHGKLCEAAVPGIARLNSRQQRCSYCFIYMNDVARRASERVQHGLCIVAARSVVDRSIISQGL